jgi:hypothetical protein
LRASSAEEQKTFPQALLFWAHALLLKHTSQFKPVNEDGLACQFERSFTSTLIKKSLVD